MTGLLLIGAAAVTLLAACGGESAKTSMVDLVIANTTVINGGGIDARDGVDVLVKDGRILKIDAHDPNRSATRIVDGSGKYLVPGLFDAHTHPFPIEETFPQFVHYGVTSIFVTGCASCDDATMESVRKFASDPVSIAPRVFHTSQHFTMEGRHPVKTYPSPKWVDGHSVHFLRNVEQIGELVERVAAEPIVGIKVTIEEGPDPPFVERMPQEFVAEIVRHAHAHDLKVFAHVSDIEELRVAQEAGVDHLLHFVGVDINWETDVEIVTSLLQRDVHWVTTLMIDKSFFYPVHPEWLDEIIEAGVYDAARIESLRSLSSPEQARFYLQQIFGTEEPTFEGILQPQFEDLRRLHELGIALVIGTDVGNNFIFPGHSLHEEMQILEMGGFTPGEVLTMATINAAEMLGVLEDLGTVETGKLADMMLLNDDPRLSVSNFSSINTVFKGGNTLRGAGTVPLRD